MDNFLHISPPKLPPKFPQFFPSPKIQSRPLVIVYYAFFIWIIIFISRTLNMDINSHFFYEKHFFKANFNLDLIVHGKTFTSTIISRLTFIFRLDFHLKFTQICVLCFSLPRAHDALREMQIFKLLSFAVEGSIWKLFWLNGLSTGFFFAERRESEFPRPSTDTWFVTRKEIKAKTLRIVKMRV